MVQAVTTIVANDLDVGDTTNQQQKRSKKKKGAPKATPATDDVGFELECKIKQLKIAHAKIQELEAENTKINKTNHILGARIKMFENLNEKDLFEKYFPSKLPDTNTQQVPCHCSSHRCCSPPPCQCYSKAQCHGSQAHQDVLLPSVKELTETVAKLHQDIADIKADLATLAIAKASEPKPSDQAKNSPTNIPLSPDIVSDSVPYQPTPERQESFHSEHDQSSSSDTNTIDEFVFDDISMETSDHLNSNVQTNQLPQLMHPLPQEH